MAAQSPGDPSLVSDLETAVADLGGPTWAALALSALVGRNDAARDAGRLHCALGHEPGSALLALGLVEALARMGEGRLATEGVRRLLASLLDAGLPEAEDLWPLPDPSFGPLRVGWEAAGWRHAGDPTARRAARAEVLRWRL